MTEEAEQTLTLEQTRLLARLFEGVTANDPDERLEQLRNLRLGFLEALAAHVGPALDTRVSRMPQQTTEDYFVVAAFVNDTLRDMGLRVKHPDTGRPGLILADYKVRAADRVPRYRIETQGDSGKRQQRGITCYGPLFSLQLMPAPTRVEAWARTFQNRLEKIEGRADDVGGSPGR